MAKRKARAGSTRCHQLWAPARGWRTPVYLWPTRLGPRTHPAQSGPISIGLHPPTQVIRPIGGGACTKARLQVDLRLIVAAPIRLERRRATKSRSAGLAGRGQTISRPKHARPRRSITRQPSLGAHAVRQARGHRSQHLWMDICGWSLLSSGAELAVSRGSSPSQLVPDNLASEPRREQLASGQRRDRWPELQSN